MIKTKDGYVKLIGTEWKGSATDVLKCNGEHIKVDISSGTDTLVLRNSSGLILSTVTDISPFIITSTIVNNNLNADLLDGYHAGSLFEELSLSSSTLTIKIGGISKDIQLSIDEKVKLTNSTSNKEFPILLSYSDNPTSGANSTSLYSKKVTVNPYTGILTTSGIDFTDQVILGSNSIGNSTLPIYLNGGLVTSCDFKIWKGTAALYAALTKDSNTLYFIY